MPGCAAATIVAKPYWSFARVLARSFTQQHPEIPFHVLLADEPEACVDPAREPFELIELSTLDLPHPERLCFKYAQQPLSYACTPWLLAELLGRGYERVVFFKQETLVFGPVTSLFERLAQFPIVIAPHLLAPPDTDAAERELNILLSGVYNVGLIGVGRSEASIRFLDWWQDRLVAGCRHEVAEGMHYEQRWLDLAPAYFEGVHVLRDPAYNVGHWNLPDRRVSRGAGGEVLVNGQPCRVFRFSGYDPAHPTAITRYNARLSWDSAGVVRSVFEDFHRRLIDEGYDESSRWPYAYATFDNGVPIPEIARRLYLDLDEEAGRFGDPRVTASPGSYWQWLTAPIATEGRVSPLWMGIRQSRPDLQHAFPDVPGADSDRFMDWAAASGLREHGISERLLPTVPA